MSKFPIFYKSPRKTASQSTLILDSLKVFEIRIFSDAGIGKNLYKNNMAKLYCNFSICFEKIQELEKRLAQKLASKILIKKLKTKF